MNGHKRKFIAKGDKPKSPDTDKVKVKYCAEILEPALIYIYINLIKYSGTSDYEQKIKYKKMRGVSRQAQNC